VTHFSSYFTGIWRCIIVPWNCNVLQRTRPNLY